MLRQGDWICFYVAGSGIVGHARVSSNPKFSPEVSPLYPYVFGLAEPELYLQSPTPVDRATRSRLDAFKGRLGRDWGWFVTATHRLTEHDFNWLTSAGRKGRDQPQGL